jgi:hypothetical protein
MNTTAAFRRPRAASSNRSPERSSRSGAIRLDIVMMILMTVAVIAVVTVFLIKIGDYQKDEQVVAMIEDRTGGPSNPLARELALTREVSRQAAAPLGVQSGQTGVDAIEAILKRADADRPWYYKFDAAKISSNRKDPGESSLTPEIVKIPYAPDSIKNLKDLLDAHDKRINDIVDAIVNWSGLDAAEAAKLAEAQAEYAKTTKDSATAAVTATGAGNKGVAETFTGATGASATSAGGVNAAANDRDAQAKLTNAALNAAGDEIRTLQDAIRDKQLGVQDSVNGANAAREQTQAYLSNLAKTLAAKGEDVGAVIQSDPASGYVWINLGQDDNVRLEDSFEVQRPSADGLSLVTIGQIRAKEIFRGHSARCRTDYLREQNDLPRAGDRLFRSAMAKRPFTYFAFAGTFGGHASKLTRAQLTELLQKFGRFVQNPPEGTLEVLIVGDNYQNDPVYKKLGTDGTKFERMTERELLYMFGISGG